MHEILKQLKYNSTQNAQDFPKNLNFLNGYLGKTLIPKETHLRIVFRNTAGLSLFLSLSCIVKKNLVYLFCNLCFIQVDYSESKFSLYQIK